MLTQAQRGELKRDLAAILDDSGLPQYLKVNRIVDLLEDRLFVRILGGPAFETPLDESRPPDKPPAKKKPARKKAASKRPTKRQNAKSTDTIVSA